MDPYQRLANAIVMQAVKDWRKSVAALQKTTTTWSAKHLIRDVERFLLSEWFKKLTDVDGKLLLQKLRKEAGYDS